jgi:hypothetical protein
MAKGTKFERVQQESTRAVGVAQSVVIAQPKVMMVGLEIGGTADIIQNCFSQKAVEEMLRKHMGISVQREAKVPSECIERAIIRNVNNVICAPPTAVKKAMLSAASAIKGLKKTQLRTGLYVCGGSLPLQYESMTPRMDMVRTSGMSRTPDVRFRPGFQNWKIRLVIEFSDLFGVQTVVDLLNRAGSVGIGEWRPEKDGTYGTFKVVRHIDDKKEIAEVLDACRPALKPLVIPEWAMNVALSPELLEKVAHGVEHGEEDEE